jgi:hypothetical protein
MSGDTLEIRMQSHDVECFLCGTWTELHWGVPTYNGDLVSNDFPDELFREGGGAQPACERCYGQHSRGELPMFDKCYLWRLAGFEGGAGI